MNKCFCCDAKGTRVCADCGECLCPNHGREHENSTGHVMLDPVEQWLTEGTKQK